MSLLGYLLVIAVIDSLNPTATALQVYLLTTPKPVARSLAFITGILLANWTVGLCGTLGLTSFIQWVFTTQREWIASMQFLLGMALFYTGCTLKAAPNAQPSFKHQPKTLQPRSTFLLGLSVTLLEAPTALPYLAAIERLARTKLSLLDLAGLLALYNLVFVLPLMGLLSLYLAFQSRSAKILQRLNQAMTKWSPKILRVLLLAIGSLLFVNGMTAILGRLIPAR
jgi:cytochrome c biogenesis protein CcdA